VNERRFLNQYQPQTLVMATLLCYFQAVLGFLSVSYWGLLLFAGLGFGAYGIANEKRWGYGLAVATAVLQVVIMAAYWGSDILGFPQVIGFIFDIALVALLLHPQSRDYQRIWFS
jgi:hypothetical protein